MIELRWLESVTFPLKLQSRTMMTQNNLLEDDPDYNILDYEEFWSEWQDVPTEHEE